MAIDKAAISEPEIHFIFYTQFFFFFFILFFSVVQVASVKCLQLDAHPLFRNYLSAFRGKQAKARRFPSTSVPLHLAMANKWKNQKAIKTLHNRNVQKLLFANASSSNNNNNNYYSYNNNNNNKGCQTTKSKWGRHVNFSAFSASMRSFEALCTDNFHDYAAYAPTTSVQPTTSVFPSGRLFQPYKRSC